MHLLWLLLHINQVIGRLCLQINEAFAPQFLAVSKELNLDPACTNVNGGAIALGHPLAASGARIVTNLVHELRSAPNTMPEIVSVQFSVRAVNS